MMKAVIVFGLVFFIIFFVFLKPKWKILVHIPLLLCASFFGSFFSGILVAFSKAMIMHEHVEPLTAAIMGLMKVGLVITVFTHSLALPALILVYFPLSLLAWKKANRKLIVMLCAGLTALTICSLMIPPVFASSIAYGLSIYVACTIVIVLLHWKILTFIEKIKPNLISYSFLRFIK